MLELMIAMALGLLIIAAATGVFLAGQRSLATQSGMGDLQQNAIFGVAQLTHDLRHINLNITSNTVIKRNEVGGVVFGDNNFPQTGSPFNRGTDKIPATHVTQVGTASTVFAGLSNDQLTIQFQPHEAGLLQSCMGTPIPANQTNVQRYFIQPMPQGDNRFGLYCQAQNNTDSFANAPRLMIPDVEAFKVRFGTKITTTTGTTTTTTMRYKGINDLTNDDEIVSVEVGLIMRSTHNLGSSNSVVNDEKTYRIAGQDVQLINTSGTPAFMREAFSQVVAIRNSSGG